MVIPDTSSLIDLLRGRKNELAESLQQLDRSRKEMRRPETRNQVCSPRNR